MKLKNLSGETYTIITQDYVVKNDEVFKSEPHLRARQLIKESFPFIVVLEEVPLKCYKQTLYADFLIYEKKIIIEVHGEQHYSYSKHFHGNMDGFADSKKRDKIKKEWCIANNFTYLEFPHNESTEQWSSRIKSR